MAASEAAMRSAFDLSGQRVLITGAAGGIGGVPVNGIARGPTDTEMTRGRAIDVSRVPLGRVTAPMRSSGRSPSCAPPPQATAQARRLTSTAACTCTERRRWPAARRRM
jgi:hypothetical protein